ncbi:hypothetical protein RND71_004202 [Anisodus tanguticus]|uniref:Uncharacterized protein n=1 Tax=Anisodus tanguticus TaxID=243964 RepID=A0AAE1VUP8_9SOLA|nr:hypothetical protein RND71_004202 [Anisodus tanguticus]
MFSVLVIDRIPREVDGTNIITVHQCSLRNLAVEFEKNILKPTRFRHNISNTSVFCFGTGSG